MIFQNLAKTHKTCDRSEPENYYGCIFRPKQQHAHVNPDAQLSADIVFTKNARRHSVTCSSL